MELTDYFASLDLHADERRLPGSIAAWFDDSMRDTLAIGLADVEQARPIDESTRFHVASLSKQYTAFIAAQLIAEAKLTRDTPIREVLTWLPPAFDDIAVRHLLFHTSGIRDQWPLCALAGKSEGDPIDTAFIKSLLRRQEQLQFKPGSRFLYCNSGYTLLALAAERCTGKAFGQLVREMIFVPLGMQESMWVTRPDELVPNRARAYKRRQDGGFDANDPPYGVLGSTCLRTTARDMLVWLSTPAQAVFFEPSRSVGYFDPGSLDNGEPLQYGYGQVHLKIGDRRVLVHGGVDHGFAAISIRSMDGSFGFFSASNAGLVSLDDAAIAMVERRLLGKVAPGKSCRNMPDTMEVVKHAVQPGVYATPALDDVRIVRRDTSGRLFLLWGQEFELVADGNHFRLKGTSHTLYFSASVSGPRLHFDSAGGAATLDWIEASAVPFPMQGRYHCNELGSSIHVSTSSSSGRIVIEIGAGNVYEVDVVNDKLVVWGAFWALKEYRDDGGFDLLVHHPRCHAVRFRGVDSPRCRTEDQ